MDTRTILSNTMTGVSSAVSTTKEFVNDLRQPGAAPLISATATGAFTMLWLVNMMDGGRLATSLSLLCALGSAGLTVSQYGKEETMKKVGSAMGWAMQKGQTLFSSATNTATPTAVSNEPALRSRNN